MSEGYVQAGTPEVDRQSALLRNIRLLSIVMEELEAAGYVDYAREISGLRSDMMVVAGMSSGYDTRDPEAVRKDFYENGEKRIQELIEQAGKIKN